MLKALRWLVAPATLLATLFLVGHANAKANHCQSGRHTIEAVITQVDRTDNPGDADYNFFIRPLAPGEKSQFPNAKPENMHEVFWQQCGEHRTWLSKRIAPVLQNAKPALFSRECRACAGDSAEGTSCRIDPNAYYTSHPCPKLFSCAACIWDFRRFKGLASLSDSLSDELSYFTPKAEIFIADPGNPSAEDFNEPLTNLMRNLGIWEGDDFGGIDGAVAAAAAGGGAGSLVEAAETLNVFCKELAWTADGPGLQNQHWKNGATGACGKHILLTGVVDFDDKHDMRPEIHPITSLVLSLGNGDYKAGVFIDGSMSNALTPVGLLSAFNYRVMFGPKLLPETTKLDLSQLMGPPPLSPPGSRPHKVHKYVAFPDCAVRETGMQNRKGPLLDEAGMYCPSKVVNLTFGPTTHRVPIASSAIKLFDDLTGAQVGSEVQDDYPGAAWTGDVRAAWKFEQIDFAMSAHLETPGGVLAYDPRAPLDPLIKGPVDRVHPSKSKLAAAIRRAPVKKGTAAPTAPSGAASPRVVPSVLPTVLKGQDSQPATSAAPASPSVLRANECDARPRRDSAAHHNGLRRWYRWRVDTRASLGNAESNLLSWAWNISPSLKAIPIGPEDPSATTPGAHSFTVWLPTKSGSVKSHTPYSGEMRASLKVEGGQGDIPDQAQRLRAPRPSVKLKASVVSMNPPFAGNGAPSYTVRLTAQPKGFCGESLQYRWTQNEVGVPSVGPGPIDVTVNIGRTDTYGVTVYDAWGVEYAYDAREFRFPELHAAVQSSCAYATLHKMAMPVRLDAAGAALGTSSANLCPDVVLSAKADASESFGVVFPINPPAPIMLGARDPDTYDWSDLKYASIATDNQWTAVPASWITGGSTSKLTIHPATGDYVRLQGTVTVTDRYGRRAVANYSGSNDFTPLSSLSALALEVWKMARPNQTAPALSACPSCGGGEGPIDPVARWYSVLGFSIENARANTGATQGLRTQVEEFRHFAATMLAAKKYKRKPTRLPATQFTKSPVHVSHETIQSKARARTFSAMKTDATLLRALPNLKAAVTLPVMPAVPER